MSLKVYDLSRVFFCDVRVKGFQRRKRLPMNVDYVVKCVRVGHHRRVRWIRGVQCCVVELLMTS